MSHRKKKRLTILFLALFLAALIMPVPAFAQSGELFVYKWKYVSESPIRSFEVGVGPDGSKEIVIASEKNLYILDGTGKLRAEYKLGFVPSAINLANVDDDPEPEILLGSGYMETVDLDVERFDFSDTGNIREREQLLYKVIRNNGSVYLIDDGVREPVKILAVGEWVRDIYVDDLDYDGVPEILVASGGPNQDFIEKISLGVNNETGNQTYIRNFTTLSYENGTIGIYALNGTLLQNYTVSNKTFYYVHVDNLDIAGSKKIITGADRIRLIDASSGEADIFEPLDGNYSIREVVTAILGDRKDKSILAAFVGPDFSGVYAVDKAGYLLWNHRASSNNVRGLHNLDVDADGLNETVFTSQKTLYVLDSEGGLEWNYLLPKEVSGVEISDLDVNGYVDFIYSEGKEITVYEISSGFIESNRADRYYAEASQLFERGKYAEALSAIEVARTLYLELSKENGVSESDALKAKINTRIMEERLETAHSLYRNGLKELHTENYLAARDYLEKAREIFVEYGDENGIEECDKSLRDVEIGLEEVPATTLAQGGNGGETPFEEEKGFDYTYLLLFLLSVVVIGLLLAVGLKRKGSKDKDVEHISEGEETEISSRPPLGGPGDEFSEEEDLEPERDRVGSDEFAD